MNKRKVKRWIKRWVRRMPKVAMRLGKRAAKRSVRKTKRRLKKTGRFTRRLFRSGPKKLTKRWVKRKTRPTSTKRTTLIRNGQLMKSQAKKLGYAAPPVRRGWRHDIVPGRTVVEWRTAPHMGRGRVLAYLPAERLDVEFESGGRPPSGVPLEEIRVLA